MATTREVITKWGFDVDHTPLNKIEHQLEVIKGTLEFLAAAEVIHGIVEMAEKMAEFAEQTHIAAISAGITVEKFQELAFAAKQSSVSQEEMSGAMARLGRHLYEARQGGEQAQMIFQKAGFTPQQIHSFKTSSDVMLALSDRFKDMKDPIEKQAIAMQLMGRGSFNMVAFLSQGGAAIRGMGKEAEHLGAVLGEEQIENLVELEHSFQKLFGVIKALTAGIAADFAPSIKDAIDSFLKFYTINQEFIKVNFKAWAEDISYTFGFIWGVVETLSQKFFDFAQVHPLLVRRIGELAVTLGFLVGIIWTVQKAMNLVTGSFNVLKSLFGPIEFAWGSAILPVLNLFKGLIADLVLNFAILIETAFPALSSALLTFGAFIEATPVGWLITGLVALIAVLHDAWTMLTGGNWEDTWVYKAADTLKGWGKKAMNFIGLGDEGEGGAAAINGAGALNAASGLNASPSNIGYEQNASHMEVKNEFNITVPEGTPHHEVTKVLGDKMDEHLATLQRRTAQSLQSPMIR